MDRRTPLAAGAALAALALLAGCGESPGEPSAGASTSPSFSASVPAGTAEMLTRPWLLRLDTYGGPDGEARTATYVSVVPGTGKATAATMPEVGRPEVGQSGQPLLVDASQHWAVADSRPSDTMRTSGRVVVYDLRNDAKPRVVALRSEAGDDGIDADWVSFDPTEPRLLRVVSGTSVWKVTVPDGSVTRDGSLPKKDGWIYGGGFDQRTGAPFIESIDSYATLPAGNGTERVHLLQRDGGTQVDTTQGYGDLPDPGKECGPSAAFTTADGTTLAFCVVGRTVKVKTLVKDAKEWTELSTSAPVAPAQSDPQFVAPPTS